MLSFSNRFAEFLIVGSILEFLLQIPSLILRLAFLFLTEIIHILLIRKLAEYKLKRLATCTMVYFFSLLGTCKYFSKFKV